MSSQFSMFRSERGRVLNLSLSEPDKLIHQDYGGVSRMSVIVTLVESLEMVPEAVQIAPLLAGIGHENGKASSGSGGLVQF